MIENKVIYQVYPKSFNDSNCDGIGDIQGIIQKIDHIIELGVDYIWLSPINKSPQNDNGYDISDYYKVDSIFGNNEDYYELLEICNKRNVKLILDLVLNHVSIEHEWFKKAIAGDQYYQDFFIFRDEPNELQSGFGGSAWTYEPNIKKYYLHLFDETQADLNWDNEIVRKELYKMVNFWKEKGVEGFRLDVIDLIGKDPDKLITARGPKFLTYLQELSAACLTDVFTVGECWNSGTNDAKMMTDAGLSQVFHFFHINWIYPKWTADKITLPRIAELQNEWQNQADVVEALVQNNHDLPRYISYFFGNNLDYHYEKATLLHCVNLLSRGNTYIYQGEEIGMTNCYNYEKDDYDDVETRNYLLENDAIDLVREISRDNARSPMQWDKSTNAGFSETAPWIKMNSNFETINVETDISSDKSIYKFYQEANKFKRDIYDVLTSNNLHSSVEEDCLFVERGELLMVLNFSDKSDFVMPQGEKLFGNYSEINDKLRPFEVVVLRKDENE